MTPEEIREFRKGLGMTEGEFARFLSVSPRTVYGWERGDNPPTGTAGEVLRGISSFLREYPGEAERTAELLRRASGFGGVAYLVLYLFQCWVTGEEGNTHGKRATV